VNDTVIAIPWHNIDNAGPAGSINSSVTEMAEWVRFQLGGGLHRGKRFISERNMAEMHAPQTVIPLEPWMSSMSPVNHQMVPGTHFFMYGLGWFLQDYKGRKVVHHGGSIDGMRALVGMVPAERLGLVVLTNLNPSAIDEAIMFRVFDEYLGGERRDWSADMLAGIKKLQAGGAQALARAEAARVPNTRPSLALAKYAGVYADSGYGTANVRLEGDHLVLQFENSIADLEHWHFDTFRSRSRGPTRATAFATFVLNARAEPTGLVIPGMPELRRR
jgi:CubicO group peptidase (beta-lactamase class C family)